MTPTTFRIGGDLEVRRLGFGATHLHIVVLPIPGTSRVEHVEENVGAEAVRLSDEQYAALG